MLLKTRRRRRRKRRTRKKKEVEEVEEKELHQGFSINRTDTVGYKQPKKKTIQLYKIRSGG